MRISITDGTFTDFNPTWTRDGTNTPVWNRKNREKGGYQIMAGKIGGKPGEEIALTGKDYHAWVHSAVKDGRLFVSAIPPKLGYGHFLMTPNVKMTGAARLHRAASSDRRERGRS